MMTVAAPHGWHLCEESASSTRTRFRLNNKYEEDTYRDRKTLRKNKVTNPVRCKIHPFLYYIRARFADAVRDPFRKVLRPHFPNAASRGESAAGPANASACGVPGLSFIDARQSRLLFGLRFALRHAIRRGRLDDRIPHSCLILENSKQQALRAPKAGG